MSISLDGFVAGPDQSRDEPLGKRGRRCTPGTGRERANEATRRRPAGSCVRVAPTSWAATCSGRSAVSGRGLARLVGAEPPYHAPVFVLTHHAREPIEMEGGTTFHFVTGGFDAAYAQARETAGDEGVDIAGGASTVRQALLAGSSTSSRSTSPRFCSGPASGSSTASSPSPWSRWRCCTRRWRRTSGIAGRASRREGARLERLPGPARLGAVGPLHAQHVRCRVAALAFVTRRWRSRA